MRRTHRCVGEFHSHPLHAVEHIKPPSDSDLYQLMVAAYRGVHGCSVVLAPEGVYWYSATPRSILSFERDMQYFWDTNNYTPTQRNNMLLRCRHPIHNPAPTAETMAVFHRLHVAENFYMDLMKSVTERGTTHHHTDLVAEYHRFLEPLGAEHLFLPWSSQKPRTCGPAQWQEKKTHSKG